MEIEKNDPIEIIEEVNIKQLSYRARKAEAEYIFAKRLLDDLETPIWSYETWEQLKDTYLQGKVSFETWERYYNEFKKIEKALTSDGYIWDEDAVIKTKSFPIDIYDDTFFYGLLLPKMADETNKNGEVIGQRQIAYPCLITSNRELISWDIQAQEELKIKFGSIPSFVPKRWRLEHTRRFLDGNDEKVDPIELLRKVESQYRKYLAIRNDTWYKIHALWDIGTYIYQAFEAYPFLELRGIAGTGKTKSMTISSYISFNGGQIMVNPSEATLFREKDEVRGTSYFDEAEKLWVFNGFTKQYDGDVRTELINASYTKEGKVPRQEKIGNKFYTKWYSPYGPTQLGSITGLHGATETRAITRITTKSPNEDDRGEMEPTEDRKSPIWEEIRDECYRFGLIYWNEIQEIYFNFPKDTGLKRRDLQIWKPLLSIAKFISEYLFDEVISFAKEATQRRADDSLHKTSFDYEILEALKICLEKENDKNKIYVDDIKIVFCEKQNNFSKSGNKYLNKNISSHLDNLGFKDLRRRDNRASFFEITKEIYNEIVAPICPTLAFSPKSSPFSTQPTPNQETEVVEMVISGGNGDVCEERIDEINFPESKIKEELEDE